MWCVARTIIDGQPQGSMVSDFTRRTALVGFGTAVLGLAGMRGVNSGESRPGSSDWPMARYDAAGTGYNPSVSGPKDAVRVKWRRTPSGFYGGSASPILLDDTVYAVGGGLIALDAETGATRFVHAGSYRSSLARADATAYTADTLAVTGSVGVFGLNADGGLGIRDIEFGIERWHISQEDTGITTNGPPSAVPPVAVDNTVYAVLPGTGHLTALSASSGRKRWGRSPGDGLRRLAVHNGTVFAVRPFQVSAYDAATGTRRWPSPHDLDEQTVLAPTATDDSVIVPDRTGVTALDTTDGSEQWRFDHGGNVTEGATATANERVFVASGEQDGSIYALDLTTGEPLWSAPVGDEGTPVVADGVVYVPGRASSELIALDATTGTVRWRFKSQFVPSTPVIGTTAVYFVAGDRIIALEEK